MLGRLCRSSHRIRLSSPRPPEQRDLKDAIATKDGPHRTRRINSTRAIRPWSRLLVTLASFCEPAAATARRDSAGPTTKLVSGDAAQGSGKLSSSSPVRITS
jgi:hypothetical protein